MVQARIEIAPYDGKGDFQVWCLKMKAVLSQHKVLVALEEETTKWSEDEKKRKSEIEVEAYNLLILSLGDSIIRKALSSCSRFHEYLNNIVEEYEALHVGQVRSMLPLTIALADLMEELITLRDRNVTLSPRKVMCVVQCYNTSFSFAVQQDAAEVFLHLLSSLREEVSASYNPNNGSLIDVSAVPRRILDPRMLVEDQNEQKRWKELYLGPFDGILGNILTCRSCSFQIMMDYEFFNNLPLLPVTGMGTSIFYGCTLDHCLKQYIAAEEVDGYKCDNCWHIAAMECLSAANGKETDIDKLKYCSGQEKCDCRLLAGIDAIPVPVSRAFKQLNIARCPEILCIHLMRASTNLYGELIKLEGHISFPSVLNLSPFLRSGVEMEHTSRRDTSNQGQQFYPLSCINRQINVGALSHVYFPHKENKHSATSDDRLLVLSSLNTNKEVTDTVDETEKSSSQIEGRSDSRSEPENILEHYKQKEYAPIFVCSFVGTCTPSSSFVPVSFCCRAHGKNWRRPLYSIQDNEIPAKWGRAE